jgi:hypothetical protein
MTVTRGDFAALSLNTYHDPRYPLKYLDYVTISPSQHFDSGLYVETYQNIKTGEIVIAARGTYLSSIESAMNDLRADFGIGFNQIPDQYKDYKNYVNSVRDKYQGTSIYLTGHSLAGAYPQLYDADCALHFDTENRTQLPAVTFGAPGASGVVYWNWTKEVVKFGGIKYLSSCLSIENYARTSDPVPYLTWPCFALGRTTLFPSYNLIGFDAHSAYNYFETAWTYQTGGATDATQANATHDTYSSDQNNLNTLEGIKLATKNYKMNQEDEKELRDVQGVAHKYLLAPDDPAFIDATLSLQDMANGYYLEYNEYGVKRRITASGKVHPDDLVKDQKQQEYEKLHSDAILRTLTPEEEFKGQVHEGTDYVPIASFLNNIKKVSSGTDYPDFAATLGEIRDTKNNIFEDVASFGVDVLKGVVGLAKTGVSILGEEAEREAPGGQ